jgi:hypothetical protein
MFQATDKIMQWTSGSEQDTLFSVLWTDASIQQILCCEAFEAEVQLNNI